MKKISCQYSLITLVILLLFSCSKNMNDYPLSSMRSIIQFQLLPNQNSALGVTCTSKINDTTKLVTLTLPASITADELSKLRPQITLSPYSTVAPGNLEEVDFRPDTVRFVVTAQNGKSCTYSVVKSKTYLYTSASLYSVTLPNFIDPTTLLPQRVSFPSSGTMTATLTLQLGTDLSALMISFEKALLTKGSTMTVQEVVNGTYRSFTSPGLVDFSKNSTKKVWFKVVSEDGKVSTSYSVTITLK